MPTSSSDVKPSAALLLNPKAFKRQMAHGSPKPSKTQAPTTPTKSVPHYDPRQLLNPTHKGTMTNARDSESRDEAQTNGTNGTKRSHPPNGVDSSNLLERSWGVETRKAPTAKRQKLEDDETKTTSSFSRNEDGLVGKYLRDAREEAAAKQPPTSVIDLTADDDEPIFAGEASMADREVCYGQLHAKVQADMVPRPSKHAAWVPDSSRWPMMRCDLVRKNGADNNIITAVDPSHVEFGRLDPTVASAIVSLLDSEFLKIRLQGRLSDRTRKEDEWPGRPTSQLLDMRINVYGVRRYAEQVGKHLSQRNVWFTSPFGVDKGIVTVNPHEHKKAAWLKSSGQNSVVHETRTAEEVKDAVSKMLDTLEGNAEKLALTEPHSTVKTPLLEHQKQGLTFLLGKEKPRSYGKEDSENTSFWRKSANSKGQTVYKDLVSGIATFEEPDQVLGGILADVMGLGKTIETLSLIAATMDEAETFGKAKVMRETEDARKLLCNCKTTLLVSPLSAVKNWEDQILEHVSPESLSSYIYHGPKRSLNPLELATYDIVITTYSTIASDMTRGAKNAKLNPLQQLKFFRIVLDEAHTIREQKANHSQAIFELSASRRWALTGTPVQNRLDDLGSLFTFLRLAPYDNRSRFGQYILTPFKKNQEDVMKKLRILVASCTLRRLKDRIELPPRQDLIVKLKFTPEEQRLHDFFKTETLFKLDIMTDEKVRRDTSKQKAGVYIHALQGILSLRQISSHGKELLSKKDRARLKGATPKEAIDIDGPARGISAVAAFELVDLMQQVEQCVCHECGKSIAVVDTSTDSDDERDNSVGYMLPCYDLVCEDCFSPHEAFFDDPEAETKCPFCKASVLAETIKIDTQSVQDHLTHAEESKLSPKEKKKNLHYEGPSTKALALLNAIQSTAAESVPLVARGEPPIKSVVFSEWTSMLDLLEIMLNDHAVPFTRLDGSMSLPKRRTVLDDFNTDNDKCVLLASIKAAGQGLNLTAASRVYIMEPLWNPAAEQQALDRVHRLGQTREVIATRFIMEDSLEEVIRRKQEEKMDLANLSMHTESQRERLSRKQQKQANIKDLKHMFK